MLWLLECLYYLLQSWGIWQRLMAVHEAKTKAQDVANAPVTKDELVDVLDRGKI